MKLFEYVLIHHAKQTKKNEDEGRGAKHSILQDVKRVLARDENEVLLIAAREIPTEYVDRLDEVQVAVRPF